MAGRGAAPKDPSRRARRNSDPAGITVLPFIKGEQPELPDAIPWPDRTREWWAKWARSPLADLMTELDWEFLLGTALIHADVWGNFNLDRLAELRLQVAKFGMTLEDRARLRVQFADADEADGGQPHQAGQSARERYGSLHVLPGAAGEKPPADIKKAVAKATRTRRAAAQQPAVASST